MIKIADYIVKFLAQAGVKHIFTVAGAGNLHILDALRQNTDVKYVCNHHEQASSMAMFAYARATNGIGACLVTTGPGATNAITGVCSCWVDSIPALVVSGQVKRADMIGSSGLRQRGIQEINIVDMVRPVTKHAVVIEEATQVRFELEKAVHIATSGRRGPVWIDIPMDIQSTMVDEASLPGFTPPPEDLPELGALAARALELLEGAERPVLLVGSGLKSARGWAEFEALVDALGIPVLTAWNAIECMPSTHPLYAGRPGTYGQRGANFALQNADFLLALGSRLTIPQTGYDYSQFARAARKVYVDIDPLELAKYPAAPDLVVCADASRFAQALLDQLGGATVPARDAWTGRCRQWRDAYPVCLPEYRDDAKAVNSFDFFDMLSDELEEGALIVPTASGSGFTSFHQAFKVKRGQSIFTSNGFAEMGFDLPGTIGAWFGGGGRQVVTATGDGGIQMNIQELQTIVHHQLPIKVFVLSNNGYLTIRHTENALFKGQLSGSDPASGVTIPDMLSVAAAYRLHTVEIAGRAGLRDGIRAVLAHAGPVLCVVNMQVDQPLVPKTSFRITEQGKMVSPPLEDLYPFLEREEFMANMIIPVID